MARNPSSHSPRQPLSQARRTPTNLKADQAKRNFIKPAGGSPSAPVRQKRGMPASPKPGGEDVLAAAGHQRYKRKTEEEKKVFSLPVKKAKKLALRRRDQQTQEKLFRLREKRDKLQHIDPVRLQKILALSGVGSRRDAEEYIAAGLVSVNGKKATLGDKVVPGDRVTVKGKFVHLVWQDRLPRIIIYHKEEGEIVSRDDPKHRVSVFDRLPQTRSSRWMTIGRLDMNTSGLLIFTTHGELAHRFSHPKFEVERGYAVRIMGRLSDEQKKALLEGLILDDGPARVERLQEDESESEGLNHWYYVSIKEGRNREVRRIFESMGFTVSRLIRVSFGPIGLPSRLKRGQYYELNEQEVVNIMRWAKLTLPGERRHSR